MNPSYQKTSAKGSFSTLTLLVGLEHLGAPSPEFPFDSLRDSGDDLTRDYFAARRRRPLIK